MNFNLNNVSITLAKKRTETDAAVQEAVLHIQRIAGKENIPIHIIVDSNERMNQIKTVLGEENYIQYKIITNIEQMKCILLSYPHNCIYDGSVTSREFSKFLDTHWKLLIGNQVFITDFWNKCSLKMRTNLDHFSIHSPNHNLILQRKIFDEIGCCLFDTLGQFQEIWNRAASQKDAILCIDAYANKPKAWINSQYIRDVHDIIDNEDEKKNNNNNNNMIIVSNSISASKDVVKSDENLEQAFQEAYENTTNSNKNLEQAFQEAKRQTHQQQMVVESEKDEEDQNMKVQTPIPLVFNSHINSAQQAIQKINKLVGNGFLCRL